MMPVMDAQVAIKGNDAKNGTVYLQINPSVVERICHDVIWLPEYIIQSCQVDTQFVSWPNLTNPTLQL